MHRNSHTLRIHIPQEQVIAAVRQEKPVPHDHDLAEEAEVVGSLIESQGAEAVEGVSPAWHSLPDDASRFDAIDRDFETLE